VKDNTPFNEDLVRKLAVILDETSLTEIEYEVEGSRIKVARQVSTSHYVNHSSNADSMLSGLQQSVVPTPSLDVPTVQNINQHPGALKSPMVGSAYLTPSPGAAPFMKIGDKVSVGQTLLIIEAMKVMNPIKSIKEGIVSQILVETGSPVEFDQVLVIID